MIFGELRVTDPVCRRLRFNKMPVDRLCCLYLFLSHRGRPILMKPFTQALGPDKSVESLSQGLGPDKSVDFLFQGMGPDRSIESLSQGLEPDKSIGLLFSRT
mmetsp:Transcript_6911/g.10873  ORF Transcript_6911/g.10873 Transcript_6911/m.10873 type:complete len:102 (-) Transcript_6911:278-583(-)